METLIASGICLGLIVLLVFCGVVFPGLEIFGKVTVRGPNTVNRVALTFDDGPNPHTTSIVLDMLRQYEYRATFFVVGRQAEIYPEIMEQIRLQGHQVENHTYGHTWKLLLRSPKNILWELNRTEKILNREPWNHKPQKWFRPAYGIVNPSLILAAKKMNLKICHWTVSAWDGGGIISPEKSFQHLKSRLRAGNIVALHDGCLLTHRESRIILLLQSLLPELKRRNLESVTLNQLLERAE